MATAKRLGRFKMIHKEEEEEQVSGRGKSETIAKTFGWFKKIYKEEERAPPEETIGDGKSEAAAGKRVGWFKVLQKGYKQWPPRKFLGRVPSWGWRRLPLLRFSTFFYDLAFRFLYHLESVVLVSGLCCFFLCCGCHV